MRVLLYLCPMLALCAAQASAETDFYVPENPEYTIVDSVMDSLRFTLEKTVEPDELGHLVSIASFVDPDGTPMRWHDFGKLEGPGWACNSVGGAYEIYCFGEFLGNEIWKQKALAILDHVLEGGFIDWETGLIRPYRSTVDGTFYWNYKSNTDWLCPGSMAKVAYQLLIFADRLGEDRRVGRMRGAALNCAKWIDKHVEPVPNGWFPRRTTPEGRIYKQASEEPPKFEYVVDPLWQTSGDGLFILQLQAALTQRGLADYRESLAEKTAGFMKAGGYFGSLNHDTFDARENVVYAVGARTFLLTSSVLDDPEIREYVYEPCLKGIDRFKIREDRNGVATKGLLIMEKSWPTCYLWENAETSLAYFEAARELKLSDPEQSRRYELDGLTILRAVARHHYGPHGFLTEGVDWDNHVGERHHIDGQLFGAIKYTEPFLNNQHITEPTLFYLQHLAEQRTVGDTVEYRDIEGNVIFKRPNP